MKKILLSLAMVLFVGAVVATATGAFFTDTETSTGNTFTAGGIDLTIDSQQHYNGNVCVVNTDQSQDAPAYVWEGNSPYPVPGTACGGTWSLKNLIPQSDQFFNFGDVKPGDQGEDTISLHVTNNDAYLCGYVSNLQNDDNSQTEPEALVDPNGLTTGELQQTMDWTVWADNSSANDAVPGDNIQQEDETVLATGHPSEGVLNLGQVAAGQTGYVGVSWSLPGESGNETQTDSLSGDISFTAVQSRNNPNYVCPPEPTVEPTQPQ